MWNPRMEVKWAVFLLLVDFVSAGAPEVKTVRDGESVEITCSVVDSANSMVWFRALESSGMDLIAVVNAVNPTVKKRGPNFDKFSDVKISSNKLILKAFRAESDAGVYSCAAQGKDLKFGPVTRLHPAVKAAKPTPPPVKITTNKTPPTSPTPCTCTPPPVAVEQTQCSLMILAPLAGGCGLLLLLLLCTVLYCNSVRTRRCPHHYKRKPRMAAPGKQLMVNPHM